MRRLSSLLLVFFLVVGVALPLQAAPEDGIRVNGQALDLPAPAQVMDGVLMIPVRAVAEALDGSVAWDGVAQTVTITSDEHQVLLTVDADKALVNGREVGLSAKMTKVEGTNYVPASFLATFFGHRLSITHPGALDPAALELMTKATAPTDLDLNLAVKATVAQGLMKLSFDLTGEAQVRGEELLMSLAVPMLSPEDLQLAMKQGRLYTKLSVEEPWEVLGMGLDFNLLEMMEFSQIPGLEEPTELLQSLLLEAYMGESRTEGETTLQDVVFTYDLGGLMTLISEIMGEELPEEALESLPAFDQFRGVQTYDLTTGQLVAQKVILSGLITDGEDSVEMNIEMTMTLTPNQSPIDWPADLLEAEAEYEAWQAELQAELELWEAELEAELEAEAGAGAEPGADVDVDADANPDATTDAGAAAEGDAVTEGEAETPPAPAEDEPLVEEPAA